MQAKEETNKRIRSIHTSVGGGGLATQRGIAFQNRAAAWVAVRVLAEQAASPPWGLPGRTTFEFIRCETEQPVDDLLIGTSEDGFVFVQVKHRLTCERREDSPLASTIDQFVRQLVVSRSAVPGRSWERPLDPARDRLVLLTGPGSSAPIREQLTSLLDRLRTLPPSQVIDEAATNQQEHTVLSVIREHLVRSWQRVLGNRPSDDDLRQLLSLVWIHTLDVDDSGAAEREAKDLLRSAVLHDATLGDMAWNTLVQACTGFASNREGADRAILQRVLLEAGIYLQSTRSYLTDIERLRGYSHSTVDLLSDLSRIYVGPKEVRIARRSTQALRNAAEEGSLVVVGEPGAGKSGALHDLVVTLHDEGLDVVFLAVDRLEAQSLGALRTEIGLAHELFDTLVNWHGTQPAFIVIDALDAARSERAAQTLRDLISQTARGTSRWRIVASIRKFDLRYSQEIHQLFLGTPPTKFQDAEFSKVRHINIPKLEDEELEQIRAQSQELANVVTSAGQPLCEILRVPFNLRLIGELLGEGVAVEDLTPIRTQIELLNRYWYYRVIRHDGQGDAREVVLRRVADEMVRARALRVDRARIVDDIAISVILRDVLSSNIISEWQPSPTARPDSYVLTFAHHVLFDYAVARLLLRGDPKTLVDRLVREPELVLAIQPSLVLHFQHIWFADVSRAPFWELVFLVIQAEGVPEVGKLIGPGVAAELAIQLADLESLFTALESADVAVHDTAEQALRHVVGALLAAPSDPARPLVGEDAGPWCELLERVSGTMRAPTAYTVRMLLSAICEHVGVFTAAQRKNAGAAARRLLEFAWNQAPRDGWLVIHALQAVCRTFESDPNASAALVRRCLEHAHLVEHGYEEMHWLTREVGCLIPLDPGLVEDIYQAAFTYREPSDATTSMGGRIVRLTSTRRQDWDMALYGLAETYPYFLSLAPAHATRALIVAMDEYVAQRHPPASGEIIEETFDFKGREAHIRTDYSFIWDAEATYRQHDKPLEMLNAFETYLKRLAQDAEQVAERRSILDVLIAHNHLAVLWRRLLICGAQAPDTLGQEILPLAWAIPILTCEDTTIAAGNLLAAVFSRLDAEDRERIERAVLSIPHSAVTSSLKAEEQMRNRLLGCLASEHLVTDEAKQLLEELTTTDRIPPNVPPSSRMEVTWEGRYGEEEYLVGEGVPVEAEPNRQVQVLERPIEEFAEKHRNSSPTAEEVETILPALRSLQDALSTADADGVHPKQRDYAWGRLAEACERITSCEGLACEDEAGTFVRSVLLEAAKHPDPTHRPEYDAQFDKHPSWGSPAARIEAAAGLTWLARHMTCTDKTVLGTIEQLSKDPVPAVRFQVATRLIALYQTAPDLMWKILERFCHEETSRGVLQGILSDPLRRLAGSHADRITNLTRTIYQRVTDGPGVRPVRDACASIFLGLYLWQDNPLCRDIVFGIASVPGDSADEAQRIILNLRSLLAHGPVSPPDPAQDAVRQRAFHLMGNTLQSVYDALKKLESEHKEIPFDSWSPDEQERAHTLGRLADSIGTQIYFASGAFEEQKRAKGEPARVLDVEGKRRFLKEAGPLLDKLGEFGFPSLAHNLLKTLEFLVPLDPAAVFLRIGHIVRAGQPGGYQYESLAVDLIVRLIERYLAEYRAVFRENEECQRVLLEILDIFVHAGWPSARRLTYRLEEIFR